MNPLTIFIILSLSFCKAYAQQDLLVFKKGNRTIANFWKGATIAFQLEDLQWRKGEIVKIQNDSFYIRPMVVRYYLMGTDTVHYQVEGFSVADVYAMPNAGILIDYIDGRFQISRAGGHVHFYWIKSGWIFRTGADGYAALNVTNGIIKNNFTFSNNKKELGIAAAVFLGGVVLHKIYKPAIRLRGKYHIKVVSLSK